MASYCAACGGGLSEGANFCSTCGKAVGSPVHPAPSPVSALVRPRIGRKIAGVCQGLANQYGWEVSWTRVIAVVLAVMTFPIGLVAYGLCWLIVPEEPAVLPSAVVLNTVL